MFDWIIPRSVKLNDVILLFLIFITYFSHYIWWWRWRSKTWIRISNRRQNSSGRKSHGSSTWRQWRWRQWEIWDVIRFLVPKFFWTSFVSVHFYSLRQSLLFYSFISDFDQMMAQKKEVQHVIQCFSAEMWVEKNIYILYIDIQNNIKFVSSVSGNIRHKDVKLSIIRYGIFNSGKEIENCTMYWLQRLTCQPKWGRIPRSHVSKQPIVSKSQRPAMLHELHDRQSYCNLQLTNKFKLELEAESRGFPSDPSQVQIADACFV